MPVMPGCALLSWRLKRLPRQGAAMWLKDHLNGLEGVPCQAAPSAESAKDLGEEHVCWQLLVNFRGRILKPNQTRSG